MSKEERVAAAQTELKLAIHEYIELFRAGIPTFKAENNVYFAAREFSRAVEEWNPKMWVIDPDSQGDLCPS